MPNIDYYAKLPNIQLNKLIAQRLGMGTINPPAITSDLNAAFELVDTLRCSFDLYHLPNSEWVAVAGGLVEYKSFDLGRVLCVMWLGAIDVVEHPMPPNAEAW